MIDPRAIAPEPLRWVASGAVCDGPHAIPAALRGGFRLSSYYGGKVSELYRRQFTGRAVIDLHDRVQGRAMVAIGDVGLMSIAYVRSTGHDVILTELRRPTLLVLKAGALSSRNEAMRFDMQREPWLAFGRGTRETRVFAPDGGNYEAFVLSMPPRMLGTRVDRLDEAGGMLGGDPARA